MVISDITHFVKTGIWEIRLRDCPPSKAFLVKYLRVIILASRKFLKDQCQKTASVLTYYSLLNVVPVVAVAFAVAKGFGLEQMIEKQITQIAEKANWQSDITAQIINFADKVLQQAKGGVIAGVGVVLLFWTVISILGKIEQALNDIWEVKKSRTLVRKFTDYIAMMVFAPVLLIISSSATVLVASQIKVIVNKIALLGVFSQVIFFLLNLLPYVTIWVLLTMVYVVMPNTKIPIRSCILGGIVAGTIYQIVQWIYIKFQIGVAGYGAIYGSFAALPLLLAWLQISWLIVLYGAEIAYASEHYETFGFQPDYSGISIASRKLLALKIFHLLIKRFSLGETPLSAREIANGLQIPVRLVRDLLDQLAGAGLVVETVRRAGKETEAAFQPARTIEGITINYALDMYEKFGTTHIPSPRSEEEEKINKHLQNIFDIIEKSPGNVSFKDI